MDITVLATIGFTTAGAIGILYLFLAMSRKK